VPEFDHYAQGTPCYVELMAPDGAAAAAAYAALFGWDVAAVEPAPGNVYRPVTVGGLSVAGISDHLPELRDLPGQQAFWSVYLACDDVDRAARRVAGLGGEVEQGPFDVAGLGRTACLRDPTGARVNLWQAGSSPGTRWANEVGTPVWNELVTGRVDAAKTFYAELLDVGWSTMPADGRDDYVTVDVGGRNVAGVVQLGDHDGPPHWNVTFYVADVDAAVARAELLGFTVVRPARAMADVGRLARLADPQGGRFWVMHE
jgi:predicted enzyme related to lactoylglutathione lyase